MGVDITTVFEARINGTWQPAANPFDEPRIYRLFFALGYGEIGTPRHIRRGVPPDFSYPWRNDGGYSVVDVSATEGAARERYHEDERKEIWFDAVRHTTDDDLRKYSRRRLVRLRPLLDALGNVRLLHPGCDLVRVTFDIK